MTFLIPRSLVQNVFVSHWSAGVNAGLLLAGSLLHCAQATAEKQQQCSETSTVCFADDTTVLLSTSSNRNMEKAMTMCSEQFGRYFSTRGMKVNSSKEKHIVFYPKNMERSLEDGVEVKGRKEAASVKLLGLTVSTGYTF